MELYAPEYYKNFSCIADECRHSCCIGWEIDIDRPSLKRYEALDGDYAEAVRDSISADGTTPHFKLSANERCPHLDESGLCRMITAYGEDILCDICREHPRFYNVADGRCEVGIGASCEAAVRLILDSDSYGRIIKIGEYTHPCEEFASYEDEDDFPSPRRMREMIYEILADRCVPYKERLEKIYALSGTSPSVLTDDEWKEAFDRLEYLNADTKKLFNVYSSDTNLASGEEKALERFLAYLIFRHTAEATCRAELLESIGFALLLERLLASLIEHNGPSKKYELARIISEEIEYSEDNVESLRFEFL